MKRHLEEQYKAQSGKRTHSSQPAGKSAQHSCPWRQVILSAELCHTPGPSHMLQASEESTLPCHRPVLWEESPSFAGHLTTRPGLKSGSHAQLCTAKHCHALPCTVQVWPPHAPSTALQDVQACLLPFSQKR